MPRISLASGILASATGPKHLQREALTHSLVLRRNGGLLRRDGVPVTTADNTTVLLNGLDLGLETIKKLFKT